MLIFWSLEMGRYRLVKAKSKRFVYTIETHYPG